jgi:hypothetical protein
LFGAIRFIHAADSLPSAAAFNAACTAKRLRAAAHYGGIMRRRLSTMLAGLVMAAGAVTIFGQAQANAALCSPWPSCFGTAYQVTGTPDNSLWEWSGSPTGGGTAIRSVSNGYTLWVGCQANNGPQEDGKYNVYPSVPSKTWDFTWDSGLGRFVWVYDWWMNTPPQKSAYSWYSWPDSAHHCNFGNPPPQTPPTPTNVTAVPTSSGTIHVTWHDNSSGSAAYVVSNGSVSSADLPAGTTSYDWDVSPGTYMCFTIAAKFDGLQSPWSAYGCTTTPSTPWCPTSDATLPSCSPGGAFQIDCDQVVCSQPTYDYGHDQPNGAADDLLALEAATLYNAFGDAQYFGVPLPDAQRFFGHYEDNTGTDLNFDSTVPYFASTGGTIADGNASFSVAVNDQVDQWISRVHGSAGTFDSGWLDYPLMVNGKLGDTKNWNDDNWRMAFGHGFFRVVGTRNADSTWSVSLQLTSYYQFRDGSPISAGPLTVQGDDMRRLEVIGWAQNYDEVGTGSLLFNSAGANMS